MENNFKVAFTRLWMCNTAYMINSPLEWKPFPCVSSRLAKHPKDVNSKQVFEDKKKEDAVEA